MMDCEKLMEDVKKIRMSIFFHEINAWKFVIYTLKLRSTNAPWDFGTNNEGLGKFKGKYLYA